MARHLPQLWRKDIGHFSDAVRDLQMPPSLLEARAHEAVGAFPASVPAIGSAGQASRPELVASASRAASVLFIFCFSGSQPRGDIKLGSTEPNRSQLEGADLAGARRSRARSQPSIKTAGLALQSGSRTRRSRLDRLKTERERNIDMSRLDRSPRH